MIPTADAWTIIFSKNSTSWGSFTYHESEDALRISVKPVAVPMHNALTYEFDQLQPGSAVIQMAWDKVAVPFTVTVDVHAVVLESFQKQLRSLARLTWMSWDDAANYLVDERLALDTALAYTSKSIDLEDRYDNEMTRSKVLAALNRPGEATVAQRRALDLGTPLQVDGFARQLLAIKRRDEAFAIFRENAKRHPDQWITHEGLARLYSAEGDFADAQKEMKVAVASAPAAQQADLDTLIKRLSAKQDIN
jgi:tetratricopeptide (TPR) repeat protein